MSLTIRRIVKARRARDNAENPQFKQYWQGVITELRTTVRELERKHAEMEDRLAGEGK